MMVYRFGSWDCLWQPASRLSDQQPHLLAQAGPTPSAPATPLVDVSGTGALVFIGVLALGVAILWFIPTLIDLRKANQWRSEHQSKLLEHLVKAAGSNGLSVDDLRQIVSAMNTPPRGTQGLTQALIGLMIITLVGVAMVATLVSTAADSSDLRKTIITALLSVLATIAGFYFGARTAQISSEQATRPPSPAGRPQTVAPEPPDESSEDGKTEPDGDEQPDASSADDGGGADEEPDSEEPDSSETQRMKEETAEMAKKLATSIQATEKDQPGKDPA
jgi:hypothetical protein